MNDEIVRANGKKLIRTSEDRYELHSLTTRSERFAILAVLLLVAAVGWAAWMHVPGRQKCEWAGNKWNFTFPTTSSEPAFVCDPPDMIRFGQMGGEYYDSNGRTYKGVQVEVRVRGESGGGGSQFNSSP